MKSLEFINNNTKQHEYYDYDTNEKLIWYEVSLKEEELNKLKKDLEVLEVLKKYLYIVENQIPRTDDYFEILESDLDEMQDDENCDDFHKVKQWLEEYK